MKKLISIFFLLAIFFSGTSCSVYQTIADLSRLQFKLAEVNNFKVNGVPISNKTKISDFSPADLIALSSLVTSGTLPASFILNVDAKNPNDGTSGSKSASATLQSFKWRLFIDDKETISGDIDTPVSVPGTGETTKIPLRIDLDLMKFFSDKGYQSLLNLALNLGGANASTSKLTLYAKPTVSSPFGNITYPGELKVVDYQFTN